MAGEIPNCWTHFMEESVRLAIEYMPPQVPYAFLASCLNARALSELRSVADDTTDEPWESDAVDTEEDTDQLQQESSRAHESNCVFTRAARFVKNAQYPTYALCIINAQYVQGVERMLWWLQITQPRAIQLEHVEDLYPEELRDVIDLILTDEPVLPSSVPIHTNLQELKIGSGDGFKCTGIFAALAKCTTLRKLDLSHCKSLKGLREVRSLLQLEELDLSDTSIKDLAGLQICKHLHTIRVCHCQNLKTLAGLKGVSSVQYLDASYSGVEALTGLEQCDLLRTVILQNCAALSDCNAIKGSFSLVELNLSGSEVKDILFLQQVQGLEVLSLSNCSVSDISPLQQGCSTTLKVLDLTNCKSINDFSILEKLHALEALTLDGTSCSDLTVLNTCALLKCVSVSYCINLRNLDGLEGKLWLAQLNLTGTAVASLEPIQRCTQLNTLVVSQCKHLRSLEGLEAMLKLEVLDMRKTSVASLAPLQKCANLQHLTICWCDELNSLGGLEDLRNLKSVRCSCDMADMDCSAVPSEVLVMEMPNEGGLWWNDVDDESDDWWANQFDTDEELDDWPFYDSD